MFLLAVLYAGADPQPQVPGSRKGEILTAASTLRELAEQARDDKPTWWLWDEPLIGDGKMLAFAHAATPEAVLALLDEIAELKKRLGYPEFAR